MMSANNKDRTENAPADQAPLTTSTGHKSSGHKKNLAAPTPPIQHGMISYIPTPATLWNSTSGRQLFFAITLCLFLGVSFGIVLAQMPSLDPDYAIMVKAASWFGIAVFFALPYFVEDAGVGIIDANWKPHTYLYRLAFLVSMPALFFIATGFGGVAGNGLTHTGTFAELMAQAGGNLQNNNVGDAVILKDGFVALNLTKSIIKTLSVPNEASTRPLERGGQIFQRETHFREIAYFDDPDPLAPDPPPLPIDTVTEWIVAPIFAKWTRCMTRFKVASICMDENPIIAFAYMKLTNWCRSFHSISCFPKKLTMEPFYRCNTPGRINGRLYHKKIEGLCGRVAHPPEQTLLEEIVLRHVADGWKPGRNFPLNGSIVFFDVTYDDRLANKNYWEDMWWTRKIFAYLFGITTVVLLSLTSFFDAYVDFYFGRISDLLNTS